MTSWALGPREILFTTKQLLSVGNTWVIKNIAKGKKREPDLNSVTSIIKYRNFPTSVYPLKIMVDLNTKVYLLFEDYSGGCRPCLLFKYRLLLQVNTARVYLQSICVKAI